MSKFLASSSSSSKGSDGGDDDSGSSSGWSNQGEKGNLGLFEPESISSPPRQPVLPVDDPPEAWRRIRATQAFDDPPCRRGPSVPSKRCVRVSRVSDTHGYRRSVPVPPCDLVRHSGPRRGFHQLRRAGGGGRRLEVVRGAARRRHRAEARGLHRGKSRTDLRAGALRSHMEEIPDAAAGGRVRGRAGAAGADKLHLPRGRRGYGGRDPLLRSPWTPEYYGRAFNAPRSEVGSKWERIPAETDALIAHGPPLGRGDVTKGQRGGCVSLMKEVRDRVRPRLHVFGHIHEGCGASFDGTALYINACNASRNYTKHHHAIVVDLPRDVDKPAQMVRPDSGLDHDGLIWWVRERGFDRLARHVEESSQGLDGNEFVDAPIEEMCCRLGIHRDEEARIDLRKATESLRRQSFR